MEFKKAVDELYKIQSRASAYIHALDIIYYDGVTQAPGKTAENRAHAMGILNEELYKLSTSKETVDLLEYLDTELNKDEYHASEVTAANPEASADDPAKLRRIVYLMLKDIRQMQKIPMDEYVAYQELLVKADDVWHKAKEASDFAMYRPVLEEVFATVKKFAGYCAPDKDPYDYWLNEYEPGISKEVCDNFFNTLRSRLVPLIKNISEQPQVDDSFIHGYFPENKQDELSRYLMDLIRLDTGHCGLSTTEHPFTISFGSHLDERITTHYNEDNFASSMFSVIHEGGHALYDTGSDDSLVYTVLDGGVSMGIHESQSRFYENILGRSKGFISFILPKLKELFPEALVNVTAEMLYKAINISEPSLIRTEADEVTYCLHVMIRYELEKRIMAGELEVKDLPAEWNRLYKEYLGVDVPDDKHGVLQDSHWSGGSIGYFPSYALGSAYGAQFLKKMKDTVDVDGCLSKGDFAPINEWNRKNIWQYGSLLTPQELLDKVLEEPFDPNVYMDYLEEKYKEIYNII